jgi:competence protein ComEC
MKRLAAALLLSFALAATLVAAQAPSSKPLDIYVVDTEGGKAALFVSPTGQSLLIDSGNPGGRDTDRIMEVVNQAGLKQIDFLISTHYHVDHIGGLAVPRERGSYLEESRGDLQV